MGWKDFNAIAGLLTLELQLAKSRAAQFAVKDLAWRLADYFETSNPLFDRGRFLEACGLENDKLNTGSLRDVRRFP